jgi:hypothetical protein
VKVISKFKVTKGYGVWKKEFESNEAMRLKDNVRVQTLVDSSAVSKFKSPVQRPRIWKPTNSTMNPL